MLHTDTAAALQGSSAPPDFLMRAALSEIDFSGSLQAFGVAQMAQNKPERSFGAGTETLPNTPCAHTITPSRPSARRRRQAKKTAQHKPPFGGLRPGNAAPRRFQILPGREAGSGGKALPSARRNWLKSAAVIRPRNSPPLKAANTVPAPCAASLSCSLSPTKARPRVRSPRRAQMRRAPSGDGLAPHCLP